MNITDINIHLMSKRIFFVKDICLYKFYSSSQISSAIQTPVSRCIFGLKDIILEILM